MDTGAGNEAVFSSLSVYLKYILLYRQFEKIPFQCFLSEDKYFYGRRESISKSQPKVIF